MEAISFSSANPPKVPDHTLLRPIGHGAYGEVWLARNVMGALRAVKIIWRPQFANERPYEREFAGIQRYEPVSRSSGGLVHLLHVGRNDAEGYFYYVMELADPVISDPSSVSSEQSKPQSDIPPTGPLKTEALINSYSPRTLRSDLERLGRLETFDCLRLALDVASGLAQLHRHGLVHRDVKPGNIIYAHGQAKLADIGLVSTVGEGRTFVGTEGYIPPEGPGSPAADLYALGMALYEASTGYSPDRFPDVPPEWLAENTGSDVLEFHEVILKACEGRREHRYESAEAMQADLALLQSGQSVRRVRALERRYARLRLGGIAGTVLLAGALVAVFFANYRARLATESQARETRLREQAQSSLARAELAEQESQQRLYTALLEQARATVRSGELGQRVNALDAVRRAAAISNSSALRGVAVVALGLADLRLERELPYGAQFTLRQLDPSLERIALCERYGPVEIRATSDLKLLATLPATTNLPTFLGEWSSDGRLLAVKRLRSQDGASSIIEVWSVADGRLLDLIPDVSYDAMSFQPHLPELLVGRTNGAALWDLVRHAEIRRIPLARTPRWLRPSSNGDKFAAYTVAGTNSIVSVHMLSTGEIVSSNSFASQLFSVEWHPTEDWLCVPEGSGSVYRMDARTGEKRLLGWHKAQATRSEFSPDGRYLLSGGWDRELICWDAHTLKRSFTASLKGYRGRFRLDGKAYALETETAVQLHAFEQPSAHREFVEDLGPRVKGATFSWDGRWLAAAGSQRLGVWDLENGGPGALASNAGDTLLHFNKNGELFADKRFVGFRWRISASTNSQSPPVIERLALAWPAGSSSISVISNGLIVTGAAGSAFISHERLESGPQEWKPSVDGLNRVSPDGHWVAVHGRFSPHLNIYRLPDFQLVTILTNASEIRTAQFSPATDELALACRAGVEFWSTSRWKRTRTITDFNNQLYSPDGRTMWLSQDFHAGGLYDARTLDLLLPLPRGTCPLAVSPDGRRLALSLDNRRLQLWDLAELRQRLRSLGLDWEK